MKIKTFKELHCWQEARKMVLLVYTFSRNKEIKKDFAFVDQMRRASVSVASNIAEGFGRKSNKEFRRYLEMAQGSVSELLSLADIAFALKYITAEEFAEWDALANRTKALILGLIKYLNKFER